MAQAEYKAILFLSPYRKESRETEYTCPDNGTVCGAQTWEAPVRYILRAKPALRELLCIVTEDAEASFTSLAQLLAREAPGVALTRIPYGLAAGEDFAAGPLNALMARIQPKTRILLELTGGLRDAVMQLLLVSRMLSFAGVPTEGAVYANWNERRLVDCSHLIRLFDLVGGLQEFASFGSAQKLRAYYDPRQQGAGDPQITELLEAAAQLTETITLCRTQLLDERLARFNTALDQMKTSSDPFMQQLYRVFEKKYGKMTTPGVIRWCLRNGMLQQALTIYAERIPAYLTREPGGLLWMDKAGWTISSQKGYQDPAANQLCEGLLRLSGPNGERGSWGKTIWDLDRCLAKTNQYKALCSVSQLQRILRDYLYIKDVRNMVCHANAENTRQGFQDKNYPPLESLTIKTIQEIISSALDGIQSAAQSVSKGGQPL